MIQKVIRLLTLCFCIAYFYQNANAQTTTKLFLYVTDASDKPVDGVNIQITQSLTEKSVLDETVAYFPFSVDLTPGNYIVTAVKYGFYTKIDTISIQSDELFHTIKLSRSLQSVSIGTTTGKQSVLIPGIVEIIDREMIEQYAARDVTELLRMMPNLEFAHDVLGNIGIAVRGVWAIEAKCLVMVNGIMMNEMNYGSMMWLNRFSVDNIERIEIIRGPGAVLNNGGLASYGMINIITKSAKDSEGFNLTSNVSGTNNSLARQNFTFLANKRFGADFSLDGYAFVSKTIMSDINYTDYWGSQIDMRNESNIANQQFYLGGNYKNIRFNIMSDNYKVTQRNGFDIALSRAYPTKYPMIWADASADIDLGPKLRFIPKIIYSRHKPYTTEATTDSNDFLYFGKTIPFDLIIGHKFVSNNRLTYKPINEINLDILAEFTKDNFENYYAKFTGFNSFYFSYTNLALAFNGDFYLLGTRNLNRGKALNLHIATRYDRQTFFDAFVPQAGITFLNKKFYSKLLLARSFRAPLMANIVFNAANNDDQKPDIRPEYTTSGDLEIGLVLNKKNSIGVTLYNQTTEQTIIYSAGPIYIDDYNNGKNTGTRGIDVHSKWNVGPLNLLLNFGLYQTNTEDSAFQYHPEKMNYGIPSQRLSVSAGLDLEKLLGWTGTHLMLNYLYTGSSFYFGDSISTVAEQKPANFLNATLQFRNIKNKGLNISLGVYDILDQRFTYVQPYNRFHAPIRGTGREFFLKISYNIE